MSDLQQIAEIIHGLAETTQCCATVIALMVGGLWTYWLFVQKRQKYPRASIQHRIRHWRIGEGKTLLHVDVTVSNVGDVLISLEESATILSQVLPLPTEVKEKIMTGEDPVEEAKTDIDWTIIRSRENHWKKDECEIEPGESQGIQRDFVLDDDVRSVHVYSYVINEKKRPELLSWDVTTLYDISDPEG